MQAVLSGRGNTLALPRVGGRNRSTPAVEPVLPAGANLTTWAGTATVTTVAGAGADGVGPAYDIADTSATVSQQRNTGTAVTADTVTRSLVLYVKKGNTATSVSASLAYTGGTGVTLTGILNTSTGVGTSATIVDYNANYWKMTVSLANNGTNTTLTATIFPAQRENGLAGNVALQNTHRVSHVSFP